MAYGEINARKLHLDKSGRVVLPKPLRQRPGLRPGTTFEATEAADGILLRPITEHPSLVEHNGFLVHTGRGAETLDWQQLSRDLQAERLRDIFRR
jgi:AbrB family looped-hinge helix DNA binding protein